MEIKKKKCKIERCVTRFAVEVNIEHDHGDNHREILDLIDTVYCIGRPVGHSMEPIGDNECCVTMQVDEQWFQKIRSFISAEVEVKVQSELTKILQPKTKSSFHVEGLSSSQYLE